MRREGRVCLHVPSKRCEELPEYCVNYYNKSIFTNKSIRMPYYCPNGRQHCSMCSRPEQSGKYKRKQLKDIQVMLNKDSLYDNY